MTIRKVPHPHESAYEVLDALGRMAQLLAVTARTYDGTDTVSGLDFSRLDGGL
ncbi:MAG: hypothetical protein ACRDRU_12455 [Pseudonocardiaceae bacterium]